MTLVYRTMQFTLSHLAAWLFLAVLGFGSSFVILDGPFMQAGAVAVVLLALPSFFAAWRTLGARKAALLLLCLSAFALGIETLGLITGFPYGHFWYGDYLGWKIAGVTPWTVPFGWVPLALAAAALARQKDTLWSFVAQGAVWLTLFDLVLDPGAVALGYWHWRAGGWYYGIPWTNFAGWLLSGALGMLIIRFLAPLPALPHKNIFSSAFFLMAFWTGVALAWHLWIPALLGILLSLKLFHAKRAV